MPFEYKIDTIFFGNRSNEAFDKTIENLLRILAVGFIATFLYMPFPISIIFGCIGIVLVGIHNLEYYQRSDRDLHIKFW